MSTRRLPGARPSVAPPLPQQVPVLSAAKIEIASQDAKLIPVLPLLCAADVEQLALMASRSWEVLPDSACVFKMVQPLWRVVMRWRPFGDVWNGCEVVLSEPCLIAVTLK